MLTMKLNELKSLDFFAYYTHLIRSSDISISYHRREKKIGRNKIFLVIVFAQQNFPHFIMMDKY